MNNEIAKILSLQEMVYQVAEAAGSIRSFGVGNYSPSPVESLIRANAIKHTCSRVWGWDDAVFTDFMNANALVWGVASNGKITYEALDSGDIDRACLQAREWVNVHLNAAFKAEESQ